MYKRSWTINYLALVSAIFAFGAFGTPGPVELAIICLALLLLFGAKRLPEIGKSLGSGIKEFKKSVTAINDETDVDVDVDKSKETDKT